jgi:hypothetical protein
MLEQRDKRGNTPVGWVAYEGLRWGGLGVALKRGWSWDLSSMSTSNVPVVPDVVDTQPTHFSL